MINSKQDLKNYLDMDRKALGISKKSSFFKKRTDIIYRFEVLMRKCEYYKNTHNLFMFYLLLYKYKKLSLKLGFSIPLNVFGPGLGIAHYGTIVVNSNSCIGKNCRIHECVTIGSTNGSSKAPILGDNVFIGSGAKIIGDIHIGNNVCIGAGAVVVSSYDDNMTIGGVPAKKISNNDSSSNLKNTM